MVWRRSSRARRYSTASTSPLRDAATAPTTVLSFVPPLAHFYNEAYGEGLLSAGLNAASVGIIVANLVGGYWISGILGGGIALDYTLMGNRERNAFLVHKNNTNGPIAFGERLRALLGDILNDYD